MQVGALQIHLDANIARLAADMNAAKQSVGSAMAQVEKAVMSAKAALATLGVGLSIAQFATMIKGATDAADALNDMSQRFGIGVRELAKYQLAAQQSGTSLEALGKGMKGLSDVMLEHGKALQKAGVSAKDADGAMQQLADIFQVLPDGIEKTALATKLFGKAGLELIPMLNGGSAGLKKAAEDAERYAEVMSVLAPQADHFNDQLAQLKLNSQATSAAIAANVIPTLNKFLEQLIDGTRIAGGFWAAVWKFGTANPFKTPGESIKDINKQIDDATAQMERFAAAGMKTGNILKFIEDKKKERSFAEMMQRQDLPTASYSNEGRGLDTSRTLEIDRIKKAMTLLHDLGDTEKDKAKSAYDSLIASIKEKIALSEAELAAEGKLTEAEKYHAEMAAKIAEFHRQNPEKSLDEVKTLVAQAEATLKLVEAKRQSEKIDEEAGKRIVEAYERAYKETQATIDGTKALRDNTAEMLLTADALLALKQARIDDEIASQQRALALLSEAQKESLLAEQIRQHIAALEDRKAAMSEAAATGKMLEGIKAQADAWRSVEGVTHNMWNNFETEGLGTLKRIRDAIKSGIWDMLYQLTVKKFVIQVVASVSGEKVAQEAFGVASGAGSALSLSGTIAKAGTLFGSEAITAFGEGMSGTTGVYASQGTAAFGAGSTVAAALPWIAAAVIAYEVFAKKGGGPQQGEYATLSGTGTYSPWEKLSGGDVLGNQALSAGVMSQIAALAAAAGKSAADISIAQGYKLDPQGTAAGLAFRSISIAGQKVSGGNFDGNNGADFVTAHDDGKGIATFLGTLHTAELQALITALGDPKLIAASDALMKNFGELEKSLPAYLTAQALQKEMARSMMTDAEKLAATTADLETGFTALGLSVPKSTEDFRDLILSIDLTTAAGQYQLAQLNKLGPGFLAVAQEAAKTEKAVDDLAESMAGIRQSLSALRNENGLTAALETAKANAAAAMKAVNDAYLKAIKGTQAGDVLLATGNKTPIHLVDLLNIDLYADDAAFAKLSADQRKLVTDALATAAEVTRAEQAIVAAQKSAMESVAASYQAFVDAVKSAREALESQQNQILGRYVSAANAEKAAAKAVADQQQQLVQGYVAAHKKLQEVSSALVKVGTDLNDFLDSLSTTDLGGRSKIDQAAALQRKFDATMTLANGGDQDAAKKLPELAKSLLPLLEHSARTSVEYAREVAKIRLAIGNVADNFTGKGEAMLDPVAADPYAEALNAQQAWGDAITKAGGEFSDTGIYFKAASATLQDSFVSFGVDAENLLAGYNEAVANEAIAAAAMIEWAAAATAAGIADSILADAIANGANGVLLVHGQLVTESEALIAQYQAAKADLETAETNLIAANAIKADLELRQTTALETFIGQVQALNAANAAMAQAALSIADAGVKAAAAIAAAKAALPPPGYVGPLLPDGSTGANPNNQVLIPGGSSAGTTGGTANHLTFAGAMGGTAAAIEWAQQQLAGGNARAVYDAAKASMMTLGDVDILLGLAPGTSSSWAQANGLPSFAVGTSYIPYDMTAHLHAGEEVTPRPYVDSQREAREETNALLERLLASNEALEAQIAVLLKEAEKTSKSSETTSTTLQGVTRGGLTIRTTEVG